MNVSAKSKDAEEVRQRIIDLLRLAARDVVKQLREEQNLSSGPDLKAGQGRINFECFRSSPIP